MVSNVQQIPATAIDTVLVGYMEFLFSGLSVDNPHLPLIFLYESIQSFLSMNFHQKENICDTNSIIPYFRYTGSYVSQEIQERVMILHSSLSQRQNEHLDSETLYEK